MTNEVNYTPIKYACNGATDSFSFQWKIIAASDLIVILEDETTKEQITLIDGVDYMLYQDIVGGYIVTTNKYPQGKNIILSREVSQYQDKTYSSSSGFQAKEIEESFDKLSANVQDLKYTLDRALKVPVGSGKLNVEFPEKLINDNTLVWSDEEDAFVNYDVIGEMDSFEQEIGADVDAFKSSVNQTLQQNKENTDADILSFKQSVNSEISSFKQNVSSQIETFEQEIEADVNSFKNTTNQTLQQNKQNTDADIASFKQSVNSEVSSFKQNVNTQIETFEQEQQTAYDEFTAGVDEKIEKVADAAEKIDELEESVVVAVEAAEQATKAAEQLTGALDSFAKNDEVVHLANAETITGAKTFSQPVKIQNGTGTGSLIIGGDVNASTLNNGARKLARIVVPMQTDNTLNATLLGFDSSGDSDLNITNKSYDNVAFGGSKKITNTTSPMSISFCVATERNAKGASKKCYTLEMDAYEARFNVQPNYNGVNLATTVDITNALKTKQDTLTAGENIDIVNNVISAKVVGREVGEFVRGFWSANHVPDNLLYCGDGTELSGAEGQMFRNLWNKYLYPERTVIDTIETMHADITYTITDAYPNLIVGFRTGNDVITEQNIQSTAIIIRDGYVYCQNRSGDYVEALKVEPNSSFYFKQSGNNKYFGKSLTSFGDAITLAPLNPSGGTYVAATTANTEVSILLDSSLNDELLYSNGVFNSSVTATNVTVKEVDIIEEKTLLDTCSYAEYETELTMTGSCWKWAVDIANEKFRIPFIPDEVLVDVADTTDAKIYKTIRHYVVVATGSINQNEADWSEFASSLASKANVRLDNVIPSAIFRRDSVRWGIPDYEQMVEIEMPSNATTTYAAVKDGILWGKQISGTTAKTITINGNLVFSHKTNSGTISLPFFFPVYQGDIVIVENTTISVSENNYLYFAPFRE